jgi:hypothetical protein
MASHIPINLFHILVVAPFFLYVAFVRGQLVPWIFNVLLGLGAIVLFYHLFASYKKWAAQSPSLWVNLIHVIAVAPLLIFIGVKGYDTPRWAFEILAMLAFATVGYHLYSMILELNERNQPVKA